MSRSSTRGYELLPTYGAAGPVRSGWPSSHRGILAVDGPAAAPWDAIGAALGGIDVRGCRRAEPPVLVGDPCFERLPAGSLADRLAGLPSPTGHAVVYGPGSACVPHDELWYVDVPKRLQRSDDARRTFYVDWPLEERHRQALAPRIDRFVDMADASEPLSVDGDSLRASLATLAKRPFRTRPTFLPGAWGGQWLRETLGIETDEPNLAWSYELIASEAGLLLDAVEVPLDLLLAQEAHRVLGSEVTARYGPSLPIRFDYLDTVGGGSLSVQCHPRPNYARDVFGLDYTQLETYYVVDTTDGAQIMLGLHADCNVAGFEADARAACDGRAFDPAAYVQTHDAEQHQIHLIPPGTVHASGAGNLVLEISATPYLYTLRFYDWLRANLDGTLRPVHLDHAFANLDAARSGDAVVRELIPQPTTVASGRGWVERDLGLTPDFFYTVHRVELDGSAPAETNGGFHILNLVDGEQITVRTELGDHPLHYAETMVVPASVGSYSLEGSGMAVKAFVR